VTSSVAKAWGSLAAAIGRERLSLQGYGRWYGRW
jgi:hypothetical protein